MRVGIGYDVHKLVEGRKLILGGVEIAHEKGLLGHSDADVLLHAIADALLGAASLGDIGRHFPDTDAYAAYRENAPKHSGGFKNGFRCNKRQSNDGGTAGLYRLGRRHVVLRRVQY